MSCIAVSAQEYVCVEFLGARIFDPIIASNLLDKLLSSRRPATRPVPIKLAELISFAKGCAGCNQSDDLSPSHSESNSSPRTLEGIGTSGGAGKMQEFLDKGCVGCRQSDDLSSSCFRTVWTSSDEKTSRIEITSCDQTASSDEKISRIDTTSSDENSFGDEKNSRSEKTSRVKKTSSDEQTSNREIAYSTEKTSSVGKISCDEKTSCNKKISNYEKTSSNKKTYNEKTSSHDNEDENNSSDVEQSNVEETSEVSCAAWSETDEIEDEEEEEEDENVEEKEDVKYSASTELVDEEEIYQWELDELEVSGPELSIAEKEALVRLIRAKRGIRRSPWDDFPD